MAALLAASVVASGALAGERRLDPNEPGDAILLQQKFTCSLNEGEPTYGWWQGSFFSRVEGERDRELFKVIGVNVRQCRNYEHPERGHGFRSVSREVMLYLDPDTGEVLDTWTNPWTGEELEVIHVANDPVNMRRPFYAYDENGEGHRFEGTVKNGRVFVTGVYPLFYKNPLGGDYQDYVGGAYHATEFFNDYAYEEDVFDPDVKKLDRLTLSWTRVADWLPWMKMGDRQGVMFTSTVGGRISSLDDLPEPLRTELKTNYPEYMTPPPLDDDRPNRTSWMGVKDRVDAQRAAGEGEDE
ncbi:MAG: DUF1838 family protein [Gammaproteobacteria bacterium]